MDYVESLRAMNYQDTWSKLYLHLAKGLVAEFGLDGEAAVRKAVRDFGVDRGKALKALHEKYGLKLNLYNLFTFYDLPNDPRFRRNKISLTSQQRLSETLVCPIANMWASMGGKELGRVYCEEFHHAMFMAYAPKAQVNLSQTLTQEGDDHCRFSVYLRPANMDEAERRASFEEFDKDYVKPAVYPECPSHRAGFGVLCAKLYYHMVRVAKERFGAKGLEVIGRATKAFAADMYTFLKGRAEATGDAFNEAFVRENCPIEFPVNGKLGGPWEQFTDPDAERLMISEFFGELKRQLAVK
ncbi:MAG TPA: L-2-amino-thiazoline-4-carboxylic acid hydrolase [Firmicutes bacterium]|nr:L-2-amino-thiazoline-4-carboxylic acid hydrolase [Bacillota bacterium]